MVSDFFEASRKFGVLTDTTLTALHPLLSFKAFDSTIRIFCIPQLGSSETTVARNGLTFLPVVLPPTFTEEKRRLPLLPFVWPVVRSDDS